MKLKCCPAGPTDRVRSAPGGKWLGELEAVGRLDPPETRHRPHRRIVAIQRFIRKSPDCSVLPMRIWIDAPGGSRGKLAEFRQSSTQIMHRNWPKGLGLRVGSPAFGREAQLDNAELAKHAIRWTRLSCRKFARNAVRLQFHALAYNLGNFLRTLALPDAVQQWSMTTLRDRLIKIGGKIVRHGRYVTFQMAEVAIPRGLFAGILGCINRLRPRALPT